MPYRNALCSFFVISLLVLGVLPEVGLIMAGRAHAIDEACLVAALPDPPTEIDASDGRIDLCSPLFDNSEPPRVWPETGFPLICLIELDGAVVVTTSEIGPGTVFEFVDTAMRDDHPAQSWCTSAHIEGRGDLMAEQPILAKFPPTPPPGLPCRPYRMAGP